MQKNLYTSEAQVGDKVWTFETGKFAPQANASVMVKVGETIVLATVVMGREPRDGINYLPMLIDYEEKLYAAGKIKGSRWVKREGRPTDEAVLSGRVIDRSLRPMFDSRIRHDIQIVVTVLSADGINDPDIIGLNAAAAAVEVSDIPWDGPIAGARVGKVDGKFVVNPSFSEIEQHSEMDLIVSGTGEHIIMVEAGASEVTEDDLMAGMKIANAEIGKIITAIKKLSEQVGRKDRVVPVYEPPAEIEERVSGRISELESALYGAQNAGQRENSVRDFGDKLVSELAGDDKEKEVAVKYLLETLTKKVIQSNILEKEKRVDGRKLDQVREITSEVGFLPRVHGSGLFQRGETQVLTTATLGGPGDVQLLEDLDTQQERKKRYIHHYNMPGYASGEVSPMRSPGRREVGHGALAERALVRMIPPKETFPYTLRLVSEVLSSNGSTSMASTCGSTLALMDAGVPIKAPVSGIAMGLVLDRHSGKYKILTDILGIEDNAGHMDFKVAGTKTGVTALQMDIKVKGLTLEILKNALAQAHAGRQYILDKMLEVIASPRAEMSVYAPRIVSFKINPEKIREVIGPGGKTINGIIAETGVEIDIEDDGMVMVTSTNAEASKKAIDWIKNLVREVVVGEEFQGRITRIMDFGAFAEILPGQEGLIHISELEHFRVEKVSDIVKLGDVVPVKVVGIDDLGRINLSRKALLPGGSTNSFENGGRPHHKSHGHGRPRSDHR
ncbi:MAG: polyribonucleotide nucleotidyltransferase [bacterium]|nr:polyribonucleotide nucleotidyltransferase [bacterium]